MIDSILGIIQEKERRTGMEMLEEIPERKKDRFIRNWEIKIHGLFREGTNCPSRREIMWKRWRKKEKEKIEIVEDEQLLQEISPAGDLLHYESYSRTGTGYEACVHIWDYPEVLDDYWLTKPCNQENTIVTISIHNEDQNEVKKN